jgi:transposase
MSESSKRPVYSKEFRQRAVDLVLSQKYTLRKAADSLGVKLHTLGYWVRQYRLVQGVAEVESGDPVQLIAALRKENAELKMEKEILKKAAAYFARESQ